MTRILVNALYLKWGVNGGTETYLSNMLQIWYRESSTSPEHEFTVVLNELPPWWQGEKANFKVKRVGLASRFWFRFFFEQCLLPLLSLPYDVVFQPAYVGSVLAWKPQVLTVHDAFAWRYPESIGRLRTLYWRVFIPLSLKRACKVICDSRSTMNDLGELLHVPASKMTVVHLAGGQLAEIVANPGVGNAMGLLPEDFFVAVGVFKKIKNPFVILQAYKNYRKLVQFPKKLVMVGGVFGPDAMDIRQLAEGIPGVVIAGRVADPELRWLYENSAGLVFVSLYEGFGIPILEAQRLGCPVITATNSSMPEVAGEGAILVSCTDEIGLSRALLALHDEPLAASLVKIGQSNEKKFTWEITAAKTLAILTS